MHLKLKEFMIATNQTAKQNLTTHGYLEKVLIAVTDQGVFVNNLKWADNEQKAKVVKQCIDAMSERNCQLYVMVGEASMTEISPEGMTRQDCILLSGETREGDKISIMTPFTKLDNVVDFKEPIWSNEKENPGSISQFTMFKGIFK